MKKITPVRTAQLLAVALVVLFAFGATGSATAYGVVAPTAVAAKKKAKKCKKGYVKKTVKGKKKCVKKKKASTKSSDVVQSVVLTKSDLSAYGTKLWLTVTLKKAVPSVPVVAFAKRGKYEIETKSTVQFTTDSLTQEFVVRANSTPLLSNPTLRRQPMSFWATVDGVKSNVQTKQ